MMNQNNNFNKRGNCLGGDRSPYRRTDGRYDSTANRWTPSCGARAGNGCGSAMPRGGEHHAGCKHGSGSCSLCGRGRPNPSANTDGCGCQNPNHTTCDRLMKQIRAVDFALYETILYLDVYPHSCDALETYHKLKAQKEALHKEYEAACGPITAFGNQSVTSWDWVGKPFPWEYDAD